MQKTPLVSVIIPTYKRPESLKRAIDSVLAQTYNNIELLVIDDNQPESLERKQTEKLIKNYKHAINIKYIKHKRNKNGAVARNTGIKNSLGKYVAFLDDDDEFLPEKIERQVERLENLDESWGMCYTKFIRKKNNKLLDKGIEDQEGYISKSILKGELYISAGSNLMIRRDIVEKIGGFNEEFTRRQDLEFLLRASRVCKIAHVDEVCLIIYKDDRKNELSEKGLIENTDQFLEEFSNYISEMPESDQQKVIIGQKLTLVRHYLTRKKIKSSYKVCKMNNISLFVLARYLLYLVKRRVFKQCYGFKV